MGTITIGKREDAPCRGDGSVWPILFNGEDMVGEIDQHLVHRYMYGGPLDVHGYTVTLDHQSNKARTFCAEKYGGARKALAAAKAYVRALDPDAVYEGHLAWLAETGV
jgi:hypothetical protein